MILLYTLYIYSHIYLLIHLYIYPYIYLFSLARLCCAVLCSPMPSDSRRTRNRSLSLSLRCFLSFFRWGRNPNVVPSDERTCPGLRPHFFCRICVTWLIDVCDMASRYVCHDSSMCVTWLIDMCDMTRCTATYLMCVPWVVDTCAMTLKCVRYDSWICVTWLVAQLLIWVPDSWCCILLWLMGVKVAVHLD